MFLKKLEISNFRCFGSNFTLPEFQIPTGTAGSGLNIFVGENATGKTSVLDILDLLVRNPFSSRNRVGISDFRDDDLEKKIEAKAITDQNFDVGRLWGRRTFKAEGFIFYASIRTRDESKRLLDNIVVDNEFIPTQESISVIKPVEKRQTASGPYVTNRVPQFDIFYLDKNRDKHLSTDSYSSKLIEVLKDLDFQYLRSIGEKSPDDLERIAKKVNRQTKKIHEFTKKDKIIHDARLKIKEYLGIDIRLDFVNLLEPYSGAFLTHREEKSIRQVPIPKMGSGIETFAALLLLDTIYDSIGTSVVYCIDEPELHLHPQFQKRLFNFLRESSKEKQIFIATHSPYFIDTEFTDHVYRFQKDNTQIKVFATSSTLEVKQNRIFFFHHFPLFFTNKAIFVEGPTDYDRVIKYCSNNGYGHVVPHTFFLSGKGDAKFFKSFCQTYGINAYFVFDIDYLEDDFKTIPNIGIPATSDNKSWYLTNFHKIKETYKTKKEELKKEKTFVWSKPDIKYLLDERGNPLTGRKREVRECIRFVCAND